MPYDKGTIVYQILQRRRKGNEFAFSRIGSIYKNNNGEYRGVIDLNQAEESPKGEERYLSFVLVDPLTANNIRNKQYMNQADNSYPAGQH